MPPPTFTKGRSLCCEEQSTPSGVLISTLPPDGNRPGVKNSRTACDRAGWNKIPTKKQLESHRLLAFRLARKRKLESIFSAQMEELKQHVGLAYWYAEAWASASDLECSSTFHLVSLWFGYSEQILSGGLDASQKRSHALRKRGNFPKGKLPSPVPTMSAKTSAARLRAAQD